MTAQLEIKGIRDGLLVTLPTGEWPAVKAALLESIDARGAFFQGARLALQVEQIELGARELGKLIEEFEARQVSLWAVITAVETTRSAAADLGLALRVNEPSEKQLEASLAFDSNLAGDEALLLHRTLRSGSQVNFPGHVVIIGDVNPGAEITAGGNIIVWGRLRGTVHAGAGGDESAVVCALDLNPTQLRLAGHVTVSPTKRGKAKPEMVLVREGQLVAETWNARR